MTENGKKKLPYLICGFSPQGGFGAFSAGNFGRFPTKNK
jgi:hypothetical protein